MWHIEKHVRKFKQKIQEMKEKERLDIGDVKSCQQEGSYRGDH